MFEPNYPDSIMTEQQLNIFFDYVVHGLIDEVDYPVEFHGVVTRSDFYFRGVDVEVPIRLAIVDRKDMLKKIEEDFRKPLDTIAKELLGTSCALTLRNIRVNLLVNCNQYNEVEKEEKKMYIPEVVEIIHRKSNRGEFFTVKWKDNTSTTVKLAEGETSDEYTAYLYALGKKIFGDKGKARDFVRSKKKVFEDRMEQKSYEKQRKRKEQALRQSLEHEDIADISGMVYDEMFVAPCLVSRAVFRRNR